MRRRDYITAFVIIFGFSFAFLSINTGMAQASGAPPIDSPEFEKGLQDLISGKYLGPTGNGTQMQIPGWTWEDYLTAGRVAQVWPKFIGVAAPLIVGVSGFDFGWKVGRFIDTKFLHLQDPNCIIFGCPASPSGSTQVPYIADVFHQIAPSWPDSTSVPTGNVWLYEGATILPSSAVSADGTPANQPDKTYTAGGSGNLADCHGINYNGYDFWTATNGLPVYTGTDSSCAQMFNVDMQVGGSKWNAGLAAGFTPYLYSAKSTNGCACFSPTGLNATTQILVLAKSDDTVQKQINDNASNAQDFTNQKVTGTTTMPTTGCGGTNQAPCAPAGSLTTAQLQQIRQYLEGGSSTGAHVGTPGETNCLLDPTHYVCPTGPDDPGTKKVTTVEIPEPLQNETAGQYRDRLRSLGFLGNVIFENDSLFDLSVTPNAWLGASPYNPGVDSSDQCLSVCAPMQVAEAGQVTRVGLSDATLVNVYNRTTGAWEPWPDSPPVIDPTTTPQIVVVRAPPTWTPPTSPSEPPGQPGESTCGKLPVIPPIDLSPLTNLNFGNAFPFGVFAWMTTVYGYFNVTPVTPDFNIDLSGLSSFVPGFSAHYVGSLTFFDTYMGTIRTLISFALWVGAIWYIGVTLLGFRGGGDVSDAADEGLL